MDRYGIRSTGFEIKPFGAILEEKADRAREVFGEDVDLRPTSALRKVLDLASFEDHELWKEMERLYHAGFISTATGDALDLLGEDLGLARRHLHATGSVQLELSGEAPGRQYVIPQGTLFETDPGSPPRRAFRTLARVALSEEQTEAETGVTAIDRGPVGNVGAGEIIQVNPEYAERFLRLGGAALSVTNDDPMTGGELLEEDDVYRGALLGHPRSLWTLEAVRHRVKQTDGVRDVQLSDPSGGTDVSRSLFGLFSFGQRRFGAQRVVGALYHFDILIAVEPGFTWESVGGIAGVRERVETNIREVRPVSIFPRIRRASNVEVGLRALVRIQEGHNGNAILASIKERLERRINALGLGRSVLHSAVVRDCVDVPGVVDIQRLHLRRCPPLFGRVNFSRRRSFQPETIELPVGENVSLQTDEIAVFRVDSELIDMEVSEL
jgi:uncharacterized phage protein gp47/JayE